MITDAEAIDWLKNSESGKAFAARFKAENEAKIAEAVARVESAQKEKSCTIESFKKELKRITSLIDEHADRNAYGELLSDFAAEQMRLAANTRRKPFSPYTR